MSPWIDFTRNLHRRLARRFPQEFQIRRGEDLERSGDDAIEFLWERFGVFGVVRMLMAATAQLAREYLDEIRQDVSHSLRRLRRSPGFTAIGVISIAVAVGLCMAFYTQISMYQGIAPGIGDPDMLVGVPGRSPIPTSNAIAITGNCSNPLPPLSRRPHSPSVWRGKKTSGSWDIWRRRSTSGLLG